ncbi:hypothetical protein FA15DRAFT_610878, partial [Coprinopsis marcescibilis]
MLLFEYAEGLYPITTVECVLLSELVYGHLACTLGPDIYRSETWPAEQRHIIYHILQRSFLHPSVAGGAIYLIGRLKQKRPNIQLEGINGLNVFTAAFIVASKYLSDFPLPMNRWLYITGYHFSASQLSYLETQLCCDLQWNLGLDNRSFENFDKLFASWVALRNNSFPPDFFSYPEYDYTRPVGFEKLDGWDEPVADADLFTPMSVCQCQQTKPEPVVPSPAYKPIHHSQFCETGLPELSDRRDQIRRQPAGSRPTSVARPQPVFSRIPTPSTSSSSGVQFRSSSLATDGTAKSALNRRQSPTKKSSCTEYPPSSTACSPDSSATIVNTQETDSDLDDSEWSTIDSPVKPALKSQGVQCTIVDGDVLPTDNGGGKLRKLV